MKILHPNHSVNASAPYSERLLLCVDVAKDHLDLFTRYRQAGHTQRHQQRIDNTTDALEETLTHFARLAQELHREGLSVICEASGGYEQKLLRTAHRLGHHTALVSPEHVAQLRKVESEAFDADRFRLCESDYRRYQAA